MLARISARWWAVPVCVLAVAAILAADPNNDVDPMTNNVDSLSAYSPPEESLVSAHARRMEIKVDITKRLVDEELSLKEATIHFLHLNQEHPSLVDGVRYSCPGETDEERTAFNVIQYVALTPATQDERTVRTLAKLENEFERWFGHAPPKRY